MEDTIVLDGGPVKNKSTQMSRITTIKQTRM